jgi:UDP-2-acetamido-3-amino-2,3-dideoxy-glucuronate N-acetyltransferase
MKKKVCVVGAGRWGKNHIRTLHNSGILGGIVESDQKVLDSFKVPYSNMECFTRLDDAIKYGFDGFTVATPAESHFEIARKIIESGHHILVEKPITMNSADALYLHELSMKNKVNLMVGHVLLFHPAFQKIKQLIEDGTLGDLQYIYSNRLNLGTIRTEENVFWSFAPHDVALFQWLIGSYPETVNSNGMDILQNGIHDTTVTTLKYPQKLMGHIFVSWLHPFKEHRFVVVGSKGMIRFEDSLEDKPLVFYDKSIIWENEKPIPRSGATRYVKFEDGMPLTRELQYFVDHLNGESIKISNGESAIDVMKILETATESLMEGSDER